MCLLNQEGAAADVVEEAAESFKNRSNERIRSEGSVEDCAYGGRSCWVIESNSGVKSFPVGSVLCKVSKQLTFDTRHYVRLLIMLFVGSIEVILQKKRRCKYVLGSCKTEKKEKVCSALFYFVFCSI